MHNRNDVHLIQVSFSCSGGGVHFIGIILNKLTASIVLDAYLHKQMACEYIIQDISMNKYI